MKAVALHTPQEPQSRSIIATMAENYGMRADAFEATLRKTVVPGNCSREEFAAFVLAAREYRLNPIMREIYAMPKKGGGIQPVVGVDGWYSIANDNPQFDGIEFSEQFGDDGKLVAITCNVYRKDRTRAVCVKEYLSECAQQTEPWRKWPIRMLRHKAAIQALRVAFGLSGLVDPDEAERFCVPERSEPTQPRALRTIDARLSDFAADDEPQHEEFPAEIPSTAAETPADHPPAGQPPASEHPPLADAGGTPDPLEEARAAGRKACRDGAAYEAVPKKFACYTSWAAAWQEGYEAEGAVMEAEMNQ